MNHSAPDRDAVDQQKTAAELRRTVPKVKNRTPLINRTIPSSGRTHDENLNGGIGDVFDANNRRKRQH